MNLSPEQDGDGEIPKHAEIACVGNAHALQPQWLRRLVVVAVVVVVVVVVVWVVVVVVVHHDHTNEPNRRYRSQKFIMTTKFRTALESTTYNEST